MQGWIILLEEMPLKPQFGTVRVMAPLAGCNVSIMFFFLKGNILCGIVML